MSLLTKINNHVVVAAGSSELTYGRYDPTSNHGIDTDELADTNVNRSYEEYQVKPIPSGGASKYLLWLGHWIFGLQ